MCGIFGYSTKNNATLTSSEQEQRFRIISAMAIAMQSRGDESTGVAWETKDKKTYTLKSTQPAYKFVQRDDFKAILADDARFILGHTRLASMGKVSHENAHPFKKGNILGVHNGSVTNWEEVNKDVEVDSEVIFELLAKLPEKEVFPQLRGNFAVGWHNLLASHTLMFVTHNNPLFFCQVPSLKSMFWISEKEPLEAVLIAAGVSQFNIWKPKEDTIYKFFPDLSHRKAKTSFKSFAPQVFNKKHKKWLSPIHASEVGVLHPWDDGGTFNYDEPLYSYEETQDMFMFGKEDDDFIWRQEANFIIETVASGVCAKCEKKIDTQASIYYHWHEPRGVYCRTCWLNTQELTTANCIEFTYELYVDLLDFYSRPDERGDHASYK